MTNRRSEISEGAIAAWARLVRVSQSLLAAVEDDLKSAGFPPLAWYDALLELRRRGKAGLRPYELQAAMLLAQYNLSRLMDRLSIAGYVERLPCETDRRGQILRITPAGRTLLAAMWPAYRAAIAKHFATRLDGCETERLAATLSKLD